MAGSSDGIPGEGAVSLRSPEAVFVDEQTQVIYVADSSNNRIQRWQPNAVGGETIAGGFGECIVYSTGSHLKEKFKLNVRNRGSLLYQDKE